MNDNLAAIGSWVVGTILIMVAKESLPEASHFYVATVFIFLLWTIFFGSRVWLMLVSLIVASEVVVTTIAVIDGAFYSKDHNLLGIEWILAAIIPVPAMVVAVPIGFLVRWYLRR